MTLHYTNSDSNPLNSWDLDPDHYTRVPDMEYQVRNNNFEPDQYIDERHLDLTRTLAPALTIDRRITNDDIRDADETLFFRPYVDPLIIEAGFITETRYYTIVVWNADRDNVLSLTGVAVADQEGTELEYPTLPKNLARGYDEILTLTVFLDGPPTQDTTYTLTVAGLTFELDVTGLRALPLTINPNWGMGVSVDYSWLTSLLSNARYYKEQRRPMSRLPNRTISADYHIHEGGLDRILNTIRYGHDKVFSVPIYNEQMTAAVITAGTATVTVDQDVTNYYNLINNCTHICMLDAASEIVEVKELDSVASPVLTFTTNIVNTLAPATTFIYPIVFSTLKAASMKPESIDVTVAKLRFEEFKKSG